ncbi:hypothetical protein [Geodermatophilus sp. DSM 45219]|uniref:hypothetical protein n=1 Tax=Geodermatophilus sp. DSM 45219 TaxID=1881103 RepID=UPI000884998E|nr:hypothetical protein [Geodermatophilus sp. DSM 45219]SDN68540.1 hypothetical protein SAMN05428965_1142 [Geodermatophilus sp. DSM 45219]
MTRLAALLLTVLAVLLTSASPAGAATDEGTARADRVVVVGVPGLVWDDVDPAATPHLWALAEGAPIGAVSVRAARSTSCVLDGWATLGAGNRARFPAPDESIPPVPLPTVPLPGGAPVDPDTPPADDAAPQEPTPPVPPTSPALSHCGLQERLAQAGLADPRTAVAAVAADPATARFGADPAALGEAVGCATVVGRAPALAAAAPGVTIGQREQLPADPGELLTGCPLVLVGLGDLVDAGEPDLETSDTGTEPLPRAAALAGIDAALGRLVDAAAAAPGETLLLVQGISEVNDGRAQLHVGIASGPGFTEPRWLTSASTGRAPFVQLIDVAPTVLAALGLERPASMNGQPLRSDGERPPLAEAVSVLERANTAASVHYRSTSAFFWGLVLLDAAVVGLGLLVAGGRRRDRVRPRSALRPVALGAAAVPVAGYLAGLLPWERAGAPRLALAASVLLAALVVTAVAALGPWRRRRLGPPLAVLAVTLGTLVGDVLTGSHLELNSLLGYDAIVAGRFTGYGNLSFGLLSVSALLLTAAAATAAGRRAPAGRGRLVTAAVVLGAGALTVLVVGTPALGRDFGGVLAALPGFLLLAMLLTGTRVTWTRMAGVLALAVAAVGALALVDWLRPASERSHLGRFVEQLLTGEAWTVVSRKAQANLDILLGSPLAWLLPVALVAAVWLVRPAGGGRLGSRLPAPLRGPGLLRGRADLLAPGERAALRAGLLATALSLALGAAANDSGVALPATAASLLVPLLVWLGAGPRSGAEVSDGTPPDRAADGGTRVTVVSRGSTAWHA